MSKFEHFLERAVFHLNSYYPQWKTYDDGWPICIPPALDVNTFFHAPRDGVIFSNYFCMFCYDYLKDDYEESILAKKHKRTIFGDDAEIQFFNAMQASKKLGGMLFANVHSEVLQMHIPGREISIFCKVKFQIDFVFLHRRLGIFVIEVKHSSSVNPCPSPTSKNPNKIYDPYKDAFEKLTVKPNYVQRVKELYKILTERDCTIPVYAVICFPNAIMSTPTLLQDGILHLDKTALSETDKLETTILSSVAQSNADYFAVQNFEKFVAGLLCCRDELVWSHIGENALEMCLKIERQEFGLGQKNQFTAIAKKAIERSNEVPLFLNSRQTECFNSIEKRKILCGLPGTGKTNLIMLHIEQAAKIRSKNVRIVINLGTKRLSAKYEALIENLSIVNQFLSKKEQDRPKFLQNIDLDEVSETDHFFADEVPGVFGNWKKFLAKRSLLDNVFTMLAISGRSWAANITAISKEIENNKELNNFRLFQLTIVVRGSRNIINYWANKYLSDFKVKIGHNICGAIVEEKKVATTNQLLAEILRRVQELLGYTLKENKNRNASNNAKFRPCHIAILTTNQYAVNFIRNYLKQKPYEFETECTGGKDDLKIKVDHSNNVLSQEYPIVIMVNYYGFKHGAEEIELTLASRAISRLIVLERDRMIIQREIDKILSTCQVSITSDIINHAVHQARISIGETIGEKSGDSAVEWDEGLANLRYNCIPEGVKNISDQLSECQRFSDVLKVICNSNPCLLDELVKVNVIPDTLYFSYSFVLSRLTKRSRDGRLNLLEFKDDDARKALLSFYKEWEAKVKIFIENRDGNSFICTKEQSQKWKKITRIVMTVG